MDPEHEEKKEFSSSAFPMSVVVCVYIYDVLNSALCNSTNLELTLDL